MRGETGLISPPLYLPRIGKVGENGKAVVSKTGSPILEPNMDYVLKSYSTKVHKFQSEAQCRNSLDNDVMKSCDAMKKFINDNQCMLWFHREEAASGCPSGNHFHIIYWGKDKVTALHELSAYKSFRQKVMSVPNQQISAQKVKNTGMFIYLNSGSAIAKLNQKTNARIFMGSNSIELLKYNAQYHPSKLKQAFSEWKSAWCSDDEFVFDDDVDENKSVWECFGMQAPVSTKINNVNDEIDLGIGATNIPDNVNSINLFDGDESSFAPGFTPSLKRKLSNDDCIITSGSNIMTVALSAPSGPKKSKTDTRIEGIVELFGRYNTQDFKALFRLVVVNKDEQGINICRDVNRAQNMNKILESAMREYTLMTVGNQNPLKVMELYAQSDWVPTDSYMGIFQTLNLLNAWAEESNNTAIDFVLDVYTILNTMLPKANCLLLEGASNAGKTFWVECILRPIQDHVGQILANEEKFRWGYLEGKAVARCEEFGFLSQATVDDFKQIAGGQTFQANVKNKSPVMVDRIPMIVTTNHTIWAQVLSEKDAIRNRCIRWEFKNRSTVLEGLTQHPNSLLFKYIFEYFELMEVSITEEEGEIKVGFEKKPDMRIGEAMSMFADWLYDKLEAEEKMNDDEKSEYFLFSGI